MPSVQHPLMFGRTRMLARLMRRLKVERGFRARAGLVLAISAASAPLRLYEHLRYGARAQQPLRTAPIFILGHWRSGTTQLHYVLSQDPQFGYPTTFHMFAGELMFSGEAWLKPLLKRIMPAKRPIDDLPLSLDLAQEEEYALAARSPHSFYHQWVYPHAFRELRKTYALLETDAATQQAWADDYLTLLQQISAYWQGRQLLIKNPVNTSRIRALLELFPEAKFIHIVRDPYRVFLSTRWLYEFNQQVASFQHLDAAQRELMVLENYQVIQQAYLAQRSLIPPERLIEVRFEEFVRQPMDAIEQIYAHLGLHGLDAARAAMQRYLDSLGTYRNNTFTLNPELATRIEAAWGFAFDAWQYPHLSAREEQHSHAVAG